MSTARKKGGKAAARVKLNPTLPADLARRLKMQAAFEGKSIGRIIEEAVGPRLRRWRLDGPGDPEPAAPEC